MCRINPKIDLAFKKLFGVERNKDLLLSLINSIVEEKIQTIKLKNPYNQPDYIDGKLSVLDIKAEDEKGRIYNVEMQIINSTYYGKRSLFYWAKAFSEQLDKGSIYGELHKTIVINIVDFEFFYDDKEEGRYHRELIIKDKLTDKHYEQFQDFSIHFVELPKFKDDKYGIRNALERWITFLNRAWELSAENIPSDLSSNEIKKAVTELNIMYLDKKEREYYENQQKALLDERSRLFYALEEGRQEGLQEGLQEGRQQGLEEGRVEEKIKIALNLLKQNLADDIIISVTGLTTEELSNLKKENKLL